MTERYNVLIVDEVPERRMQLKGASVAAGLFGDLQLCGDFRSALPKLQEGLEKVIVFLGPKQSQNGAKEF